MVWWGRASRAWGALVVLEALNSRLKDLLGPVTRVKKKIEEGGARTGCS